MTHTVPNLPDAAYTDQAEPDAGDFQILGDDRFGVVTGGDAAQQGTPNMTVAMSAATVVVNGTIYSVPSGNVVIAAASPNPRFDLIVVNAAGAYAVLTGTGDANPRFPVWDHTSCIMHAVYVPAGTLAITNNLLTDKRRQVELVIRRRSTNTTDAALDLGTFASGSLFTVDAAGKHLWENGATDMTLEKGTNLMNLVGSLVAQAVATTVPTMVTKAIASQTADLFQAQSTVGTPMARIDSVGNITGANIARGVGSPEGVVSAATGTLYQNTSGDATDGITSLWIKDSGAGNTGWVQIFGGIYGAWQYITLGTNVAAGSGEAAVVYRYGNLVMLTGSCRKALGSPNSTVFGTVPVGYRPPTSVTGMMMAWRSDAYWPVTINTSGVINIMDGFVPNDTNMVLLGTWRIT